MKIVFMTASPNAAASFYYWNALKTIPNIKRYENNTSLDDCDVILVMTYDHYVVKQLKDRFPDVKVGLIDPRSHDVKESAEKADFLICDSIEMEDYWRSAGIPIFRYVEFPNIKNIKKVHKDKENLIIGYHGNHIHLECMAENVTPALERLGKKYNLELRIMCGYKNFTGSESWVPKGIKVIQSGWSMDNYHNFLGDCDVGIAPNNMIHNDKEKKDSSTNKLFNYSEDDFSLRFKMPSNPGRPIIFGKLGIPCVSDFYPSALQIFDGTNGYVAHNEDGWYWCLDQLLSSADKRQELSDKFQKEIEENYNFEKQNEGLIEFLKELK